MLVGSVDLQVAMARHQNPVTGMPWQQEHQEWQQREQLYREQLERHYFAQQEAEFNAGLSAYYAERRQHQEVQQRLNQVLYGLGTQHPDPAHLHHQQHQQGASYRQGQQQQAPFGVTECAMATSPRPPLAAVHNNYGGAFGAAAAAGGGGGMQWEGAAGVTGRKRGFVEAAMHGESGSCPDSAFKRRSFRRD